MRADNECPVDLGDLRIRKIDEFGLSDEQMPSGVSNKV